MTWVQCRRTLPTSFPKARQEGWLHHAVIEGLSDAVVVPQGLIVDVHQGALQLPDLRKQTGDVWHEISALDSYFPPKISEAESKVRTWLCERVMGVSNTVQRMLS